MSRVTLPRPFAWADVEPFIARAGWSSEELGFQAAGPDEGRSVGACRKRVARWKTAGLTMWEADRVATALDRYPADIWPMWDHIPAVDVDQVFRSLRSRRRRLSGKQQSARRRRAVLVDGYTTVERAVERGPHRCAPEGCCVRATAYDEVREAA